MTEKAKASNKVASCLARQAACVLPMNATPAQREDFFAERDAIEMETNAALAEWQAARIAERTSYHLGTRGDS